MTEKELKERTKLFALRIIKLVSALPNNAAGRAFGSQLVASLLKEANELTAIFVASRISAKQNKEIANRQSQIAN